jgi:hypothetical protein
MDLIKEIYHYDVQEVLYVCVQQKVVIDWFRSHNWLSSDK